MNTALSFLGTVAAVFVTINLVPGIAVSGGWTTVFLVALAWSVITLIIRPVLRILTFPITIITFGLFAFVLNAALFWAMELVIPGFDVQGFVPALLGAVVLSIVNWFVQKIV
jgi:putative membrane protein